jgi:hypothetical protein
MTYVTGYGFFPNIREIFRPIFGTSNQENAVEITYDNDGTNTVIRVV